MKEEKPNLMSQSLLNNDLECRSHEYRLNLKWLDSYYENQVLNIFNLWKFKPIKAFFTNSGLCLLDNDINLKDESIKSLSSLRRRCRYIKGLSRRSNIKSDFSLTNRR